MIKGKIEKWPEKTSVSRSTYPFYDDDSGIMGYPQYPSRAAPKSPAAHAEVAREAFMAGFVIGVKVRRKNGSDHIKKDIGVIDDYEDDYNVAYRAYSVNGYEVLKVRWSNGTIFHYDPDELELIVDDPSTLENSDSCAIVVI